MYKIEALIEGVTPLLQHAFTPNHLATLVENAKKRTGVQDYSLEWMTTMYIDRQGWLVQPASHIEGAMVKAAASFKMKGRGSKTWKDPIKAYCYVTPDNIPHIYNGDCIKAPDETLIDNPTDHLSVNVMRVKVQRAAVARSRLEVAPGWQLRFGIEVHDEQVRADVVREVLDEAGRAVGIGDYRPRYGRFQVLEFTEVS